MNNPFFPYAYPYAYGPYYVARNYGYVKVNTHGQDAAIYVDGGYAAKTRKTKKLALRPGNRDIELRDSGGRTFFQESCGHDWRDHQGLTFLVTFRRKSEAARADGC